MNNPPLIGHLVMLHNSPAKTHQITLPNNKKVEQPFIVDYISTTSSDVLSSAPIFEEIAHFRNMYSQVQLYNLRLEADAETTLRKASYLLRNCHALVPTCRAFYVDKQSGSIYRLSGPRNASILKQYRRPTHV